MRTAALLPAAGSGERLGLGPKALVTVGGLTLLELAVRAVSPVADEVVIALSSGTPAPAGTRSVSGGSTRQESVLNLLRAVRAEFVIIHDVARPFLPAAVAEAVLQAAIETGAATACLPVADTLFNGASGRGVEREHLYSVQTPQAFRRDLLLQAHEAAEGVATDDATLVRQTGHPVTLVSGSPWLLKITHPADLEFARQLLPAWEATR